MNPLFAADPGRAPWLLALLLSASLTASGCGATAAGDAASADAGAEGADGAGTSSDAATGGDTSAGGTGDTTAADATPPKQDKPFPELVAPKLLVDKNPAPGVVEVDLVAAVGKRKLHPDVPELDMYLYNGEFPGPTLRARVGDTVIVHFKNQLPEKTTVHWHGLRISDQMDGSPRIQKPVEPGETFTYTFVVPDAGTYWYHPHVRANEQVEKGLYGALIVQEADNVAYTRERMFVMDDMYLTKEGFGAFDTWSHPVTMHGRSGNVLLVNGERIPLTKVSAKEGEVERWRVVNTANARTMIVDVQGPVYARIVGTDGGLLAEPYSVTGQKFKVPVGARYDIEVLYAEKGTATLRQHLPMAAGGGVVYKPTVMQMVTVDADPSVQDLKTPALPPVVSFADRKVDRTVALEFNAVEDPASPAGVSWQINGKSHWMTPIFTFAQGETVIIDITNKLGPEHPFHLHGQFFEILEVNGVDPKLPGLKDTALVPGMGTVKLRAYLDNPGMWMAHCHILEHAELGMMSEFKVTPSAAE